jgi:hypothetical protein
MDCDYYRYMKNLQFSFLLLPIVYVKECICSEPELKFDKVRWSRTNMTGPAIVVEEILRM